MNESRGYFAAGVLNESIYVMGGMKANEEIVGMVCIFSLNFPFVMQCLHSFCSSAYLFFICAMPTLSLLVKQVLSPHSLFLSLKQLFCDAMAG